MYQQSTSGTQVCKVRLNLQVAQLPSDRRNYRLLLNINNKRTYVEVINVVVGLIPQLPNEILPSETTNIHFLSIVEFELGLLVNNELLFCEVSDEVVECC